MHYFYIWLTTHKIRVLTNRERMSRKFFIWIFLFEIMLSQISTHYRLGANPSETHSHLGLQKYQCAASRVFVEE